MNRILTILLPVVFFLLPSVNAKETDFLVDKYLKNDAGKPEIQENYDFTSLKRLHVRMKIREQISTKDKEISEGQVLEFVIQNNVVYENKILVKKGDIATAKVETIVTGGMNGIPYYIYLGDFNIPNLEQSKLLAHYHKAGVNRTYFVLPLKWALTFLPPTGSLTNFIMGGHAKIKEKEVITVYYYPEWK